MSVVTAKKSKFDTKAIVSCLLLTLFFGLGVVLIIINNGHQTAAMILGVLTCLSLATTMFFVEKGKEANK